MKPIWDQINERFSPALLTQLQEDYERVQREPLRHTTGDGHVRHLERTLLLIQAEEVFHAAARDERRQWRETHIPDGFEALRDTEGNWWLSVPAAGWRVEGSVVSAQPVLSPFAGKRVGPYKYKSVLRSDAWDFYDDPEEFRPNVRDPVDDEFFAGNENDDPNSLEKEPTP